MSRNIFAKVWANIIALATFGLSKRYGKEKNWLNDNFIDKAIPHRSTHKLRGKGYTKSSIAKRSKRRRNHKFIVYGHQHGIPTLRNKCWGMI